MRWLRDIRKYPVGSDGGSGFGLVWLQGVHQAVKSTEKGLVQPWQVSQPAACSTLVLLHLHPAQTAAAVAGTGSCTGKGQQSCTPGKAQGPSISIQERLYRPTKGFKEKSAVLHEWLLQLEWHSILTQLSVPSKCCLYVFNTNLLTLPALAFITWSESALPLHPYKNNAECSWTKTSFRRLARN